MASTAYTRPSKPPGPVGERRQPRLAKELGRIEPKKLGIGLVAGCCLALLTYISFARLFAIYSPVFESTSLVMKNAPPASTTVQPGSEAVPVQQKIEVDEEKDLAKDETEPKEPGFPEETKTEDKEEEPFQKDEKEEAVVTKPDGGDTPEAKMTCDENAVDEGFPYARPSVCELTGDVRISPKEKTMFLVNPSGAGPFDENGEKKIRPYARKDTFLLPGVVEVTIKSVPSVASAPECARRHSVPAVVFSTAGYTDNFFHDNTDVLIPLFLSASHHAGEVQLLITNYKPWWVKKFAPLLKKLSNYEVINFDKEESVHCFPGGQLGLYRDRDLIIGPHPTRNPRNLTMVDYNRFLRRAYGLPRDVPAVLGEKTGTRPKMLMIERKGTRKLLNLHAVRELCEQLGFDVTVAEAGADVRGFAATVNSADVLLAVHGAGMTNQIFLPTGAVLVQIVRAAFATRASPAAVGGIAYGGRPAAASSVSPADAIHISPAGGTSYYGEQRFISESEVLPQVDESVLKSDEAKWAFYEHWCKFHGISRDRREMACRFKIFSKKARAVYKFNSSGGDGKIGMTQFADWTKEETIGLRGCPDEKNGLSFF